MARSYRPSRSSSTVLLLFVVAVVTLAVLDEPLLLVSRGQHVSIASLTSFTPFSVLKKKKKDKFPFPDFNKYIHTQTLSPKGFGLGGHDERVIIVGDTHGMNHSLHNLLSTVRYDPRKDALFLVGDILAKSTEAGSLAILDFLVQQRSSSCGAHKNSSCKPVHAVRGNHDQMIVQWRAWRDWFEPLQLTFPSLLPHPRRSSIPSLAPTTTTASYDAGPPVGTGFQFLALIESEWLQDRNTDPNGAGSDVEEWVDTARKRAVGTWRAEWWTRIPQPGKGRTSKDWIMFGDHYWIARDMKPEHAEFLFSLPLIIHVPSEHFFLVHGGLLPSDPRRPANDERQPLAHPPSPDDDEDDLPKQLVTTYEHPVLEAEPLQRVFPRLTSMALDDEIEELRVMQERALLQDIPQNRDPWVVLNMRGVRKSGKVTRRGDRGTPWAKIWNHQMRRCGGFENVTTLADSFEDDEDAGRERNEDAVPLPCYPTTVIYGHAASRDLDARRWSVGLDTGCLYGRRLTALILTRHDHESHSPTRTSPADDEDADEDEEESSEEEEDEEVFDEEYTTDGPFEGVNSRFARVGGGSVISRTRTPKSWTRKIKVGDKDSDLHAKLVSIKCPKVADLS